MLSSGLWPSWNGSSCSSGEERFCFFTTLAGRGVWVAAAARQLRGAAVMRGPAFSDCQQGG